MAPLPASATAIGSVLASRYELRACIGRGGMGEVFEAVDHRLDRTVAVKVLRPELADDRRFPVRLRREARTVAGLAHPGIVAVHDFGEDGERVFLVMELVAGTTLSDLLRDHGPLEPGRVARIGSGVAVALAHAHARGVVHRDVSPTNVMMTATEQVKVLDFGIARAARGSSRPGSGGSRGTVAYVAPERIRGGNVDHRADLFSLGVVLTEMATGTPDPAALMDATLTARLPARLVAALRRSTDPDPARRFDDAGSLAEELWKVSLAAPPVEPVRVAPVRIAPDPDRTIAMPRIATTRLEPADPVTATSTLPSPRRRAGRVLAWVAMAVVTVGAALLALPTLAAMTSEIPTHTRGPKPLPAPTGLTASATCDGFLSTGVDLDWSPGTHGERAAGYEVWRRSGFGGGADLIATIDGNTITTFRDADLGVDTSYTYSVRSVDGLRVSPRSNRAEVATPLLCLT